MNSRRQNKTVAAGVVMALFAGMLFVLDYSTSGFVGRTVVHGASPVLSLGSEMLQAVPMLSDTFANVQEENIALRKELARLGHVDVENKHLRDALTALGAGASIEDSFIERTRALRVIARAGIPLYGTFLVDTEGESIPAGTLIYGDDHIAIGEVVHADAFSARVTLFSRSGVVSEGFTTDANGNTIALTLQGKGHGNFVAAIPRDVIIHEGAFVYTSKTGVEPVGVVGARESNPADSVQTVRIHVPFSIDALRFVRAEQSL